MNSGLASVGALERDARGRCIVAVREIVRRDDDGDLD
jgi:hypothetical protein